MKLSKYNIYVDLDDDDTLIYNCISGAMVKVGNSTYHELKCLNDYCKMETQKVNIDSLEEFKKYNIILDDEFNEFDLIKAMHNVNKFRTKADVMIYPTFDCIFNCPYCFIAKNRNPCGAPGGKMTEEIEKLVIEFTRDLVLNHDSIVLGWNGGEPMLTFDTVCRITKAIQKITLDKGKEFKASFLTNGYLLDKEKALEMRSCGINQVGISVDGPPEVHNMRRHLMNGEGTFDVILKNIKDIADIFDVSLLTFLDRNNAGSFLKLLDIYKDEGLIGKVNVSCFSMQSCDLSSDIDENCFSREEYAGILNDLRMEAAQRGVNIQQFPTQVWQGNCSGISMGSVAISPEGDLYKCRTLVGDKVNSAGNLKEKGWKSNPNIIKWLTFDLLKNNQCMECDILPICMGGCPLYEISPAVKDGSNNNCRLCPPIKYNINEVLKFKYEHILRRNAK